MFHPSLCVGRHRFLLLLSLMALLGPSDTALVRRSYADDVTGDVASHTYAVLIGVEKYERAAPLRFAQRDVVKLAETFEQYGGVPRSHILQLVESDSNPRRRPSRASIMNELPAFLKPLGPGDTVIIYFSGHGFRDAQDRLYLASIDCDPADLAATGVAAAWLREQLDGCQAKVKLVILDAGRGGSATRSGTRGTRTVLSAEGLEGARQALQESNTPRARPQASASATAPATPPPPTLASMTTAPQPVFAADLGRAFKDVDGVITLAGSATGQESQIWDDVNQSLFSYWLCQALKGHADTKIVNGLVDVDELYEYVRNRVVSTSQSRFPRPQTPLRIMQGGLVGVPNVVALQRHSLKQVMADLVEQLALDLEQGQMPSVGVVEFIDHSEVQSTVDRRNFGLLGKWCAKELQDELMRQAQGRFRVVPADAVRELLEDRQITAADLNSPRALRRLADEVPVLAVGKFKSRDGWLLNVEVDLRQTDKIEPAGTAAGFAGLSENDWAMLGRSAVVQVDDYSPLPPRADRPPRPIAAAMIPKLDDRAQEAHPLKSDQWPFPVRIFVGDEERRPTIRGNDAFVTLRRGEVFQIEIENRSEKTALLRILVDGLNTLPEPSAVATSAESDATADTMPWARRVPLDSARAWELDPAYAKVNAIQGFYSRIAGADSEYREFKVVDVDQSLAARQRFTDQVGLITAAFYLPSTLPPKGTPRGVGVGEGQAVVTNVERGRKLTPGNLLGVVHIRYGGKVD